MAGGLIYVVIAFVFARFLFDPGPFIFKRSIPLWHIDVAPALVLSVLFGATIGPLFALRFQGSEIPDEFKRPFWFSIILLCGIFLLGTFAMFDRQTMHSRDWLVVALVLSIAFVIHTNEWLCRFSPGTPRPIE